MELIILHGAPAVGKYTVAKQLQKQTGYRLLHIHAIYDFLEEIFGKQRYETSLQLLQDISLSVFEKAAEEKIDGLIFTYAQLASDDFRFVRILQDRLEKQKVNIRLVHLFCHEKKLYQRVVKESRKGFRKTTNPRELAHLLARKDYHSICPFLPTLEVDTSFLSIKRTVENIISTLNLKRI